jgi:hypothetical protein
MILEIVVVAEVDGGSIEDGSGGSYFFRKGDRGILRWRGGPGPMTCWEAYVLWDADTLKLERRTLYEQLRTVGLDADGRRVLVQ